MTHHDELLDVMECVKKEPAINWECSEQNIAAIKQNFCVVEQQTFVDCLEKATQQM
ncbi:MAG: hypothetical protein JXX14_09960 [Deltaproteobacteria bacterium]|nr:hypothetical protein [Deltaproteobacteria bacterium]